MPTKDLKPILKRCIDSLKKKTDYKNLEIIIIDNNMIRQTAENYARKAQLFKAEDLGSSE